MKVIILAGGFAKRMWPLTKDRPKHLLDVAGHPMLSYVIGKLERFAKAHKGLGTAYISTNAKFAPDFEAFIKSLKTELDIKLVVEDAHTEGQKLGSLGALAKLIREEGIDDDLMIIGGDNLFEFELEEFHNVFVAKKADVIAAYDVGSLQKASLYGVVKTQKDGRITDFLEKPHDPPSTLAATACYLLTASSTKAVLEYIDRGNNPDAMGFFITWLHKKKSVYAFVFKGAWFDIGSFESLEEANKYYQNNPPKGF